MKTEQAVAEMEAMRRKVRDLLNPEARDVGRPNSADNVDNVNNNKGGNSESYTVRRLKRDRPGLAEKVIEGEMSANAAGQLPVNSWSTLLPPGQLPVNSQSTLGQPPKMRLNGGCPFRTCPYGPESAILGVDQNRLLGGYSPA